MSGPAIQFQAGTLFVNASTASAVNNYSSASVGGSAA